MTRKPVVQPKEARRMFVQRLEETKRSLPLRPHTRRPLDGPNKLLAAELRISPARIGNFLNWKFELPIASGDNPSTLLKEAAVEKVLAGFAESVERAVAWLEAAKL